VQERDKTNEILADLPENKRLFRINAGLGWTGTVMQRRGNMLVLQDPRPLHAAPQGWPDLVGWETIEITPDMVGQLIAVFIGEEVKVTGKLSEQQSRFGALLKRMGGIFRVHR
jgi:hypothetical protein